MGITRNNRYNHVDIQQYTPIMQQPFIRRPEIVQYPEDWENGLSSDEFLSEAKKILKKKFNDRN